MLPHSFFCLDKQSQCWLCVFPRGHIRHDELVGVQDGSMVTKVSCRLVATKKTGFRDALSCFTAEVEQGLCPVFQLLRENTESVVYRPEVAIEYLAPHAGV